MNLRTMNHWCFEASIPLTPILRIPKNRCFIYLHQHWEKKRCPNLPAQKSFHVWDKKNIQKSSLTQQGVSTIVSKLLRLIGGVGNPAKTAASSFVFFGKQNPIWRWNQPVWNIFPVFRVRNKKSLKPPPLTRSDEKLSSFKIYPEEDLTFFVPFWLNSRINQDEAHAQCWPLGNLTFGNLDLRRLYKKSGYHHIFMISKTGTNKVAPSEFINDYAKWMQFQNKMGSRFQLYSTNRRKTNFNTWKVSKQPPQVVIETSLLWCNKASGRRFIHLESEVGSI